MSGSVGDAGGFRHDDATAADHIVGTGNVGGRARPVGDDDGGWGEMGQTQQRTLVGGVRFVGDGAGRDGRGVAEYGDGEIRCV